ncbi:hypothetical protein DRR62_14545 [Escherichia coli]|nr:hypothetical protein [Escherichia coli]
MARPAGFEPAAHDLEVPRTTFSVNNLPRPLCAHTSHYLKTCKALQAIVRPYVSQFCPSFLYQKT